ncbi:leukocyte cysteine proteinase inhibitor 1-like [Hyla sarda]|uniref:leukocyte cysteine proteinase inhibitor 1-like n=1 Tax=Hyla sarda TaxID=327740 RepID=UPI0024C21200|nr:leukocyte cysteine proteinase inhibitor 1-like [Hyla sarda]
MDGVKYKCGVIDPPVLCGAASEEKPADPEVQAVVDSVKTAFEAQSGVNAAQFTVVKYASQCVAGTNYFVKVSLGGNQFCHLRIYEPLPHTREPPRLDRFLLKMTEEDPVVHF